MTFSPAPTLPDIEVQARQAAASANTVGVQIHLPHRDRARPVQQCAVVWQLGRQRTTQHGVDDHTDAATHGHRWLPHVHRLAFTRNYGPDHVLVMASLNNQPFSSGYAIDGVADGRWREVFNSDAALYGGWNDGNGGADLPSGSGRFTAVLPRAGFVVFRRL